MKTKLIIITAIISLFILSIVLIMSRNFTTTNVYCNNVVSNKPVICNPSQIPKPTKEGSTYQIDPNDVMMYYKIDDYCNFQTLTFDPYGMNNWNPYTVLGRFIGESHSDNAFKIDRLEVEAYKLMQTAKIDTMYHVMRVVLDSSSTHKNLVFNIEIKKDTAVNDRNLIDYTYGLNSGENPIIIDKNALINFTTSVWSPGNPKPINGGYECNGKAITSN